MKKLILVTAMIVLIISQVMAGGQSESKAPKENKELHLYIWTEYMDPEIITDFEEMYDCTVVIDYYESNEEMLAKLQAGGASQYDLVVPSDYIMVSLIELGLLQPMDKSVVTNVSNLSENFISPPFDKGNVYSAAYQWGTVGMLYDSTSVGDYSSWATLFENPYNVPFVLMDSEREQIGVVLAYLGYDINTLDKDQLMEAADVLIKAKKKPGFQGFEANVGGRNKLMANAVEIAMGYNGDGMTAVDASPDFGFIVPKEGTVIWMDSLCIPAEAPNPALANKFIQFILEPEIGARLSNYIYFATPNAASLPMIDEEALSNPAIYPDEATQKKLQYIQDLGKNNQIYSELWQMIKTR